MITKIFSLRNILMVTLIVAFVCAGFSSVASARDERKPRRPGRGSRSKEKSEKEKQMMEQAEEAASDIDDKLQTVLELINSGGVMEQDDIDVVAGALKENSRFLLRMDEVGQSNYHILSAWTNYFSGDDAKAVKDSLKAFKTDSENDDAKATLAAMAVLTGDYKVFGALRQQQKRAFSGSRDGRKKTKKSSRRPRPAMEEMGPMGPGPGMEMMGPMGGGDYGRETKTRRRRSGSKGTLDFDVSALKMELIGKKFEAARIKSINGAEMTLPQMGTTDCVFVWKTDYSETAAFDNKTAKSRRSGSIFNEDSKKGNGRRNKRDKERGKESWIGGEQLEAFKDLFIERFDDSSIRFAAVNVDYKADKKKIVEYLLDNSGPWTQVILAEQKHPDMSKLSKIKTEEPVLVIVGNDGQVRYAGEVIGFMPGMLLDRMPDISETQTTEKEPDGVDEQLKAEPNEIEEQEIEAEKTVKVSLDKVDETQQLIDETEAGKLYQLAEIHYKKGKFIGYKKAVDACREIIEKHPDTSYAPMAREMLRKLPRRKRELYKVTNEELGLD